jgi:hypothetical protein
MTRFIASFLSVTTLFITASAHAAPTPVFNDGQIAQDAMTSRGDTGTPGITLLADTIDPVVMFSAGPASLTPTHLMPSKPGAPTGFGDADSGKPTKSVVEVVPLPAPAGMAIAGLLLIGSIRRR